MLPFSQYFVFYAALYGTTILSFRFVRVSGSYASPNIISVIKSRKISRSCSTYERDEICVHSFCQKT
jgi:hypothetical protein